MLLLLACQEQVFKVENAAPVARIDSPVDGAAGLAEGEHTLLGYVTDAESASVHAYWAVDGLGACDEVVSVENIQTRCTVTLTAGTHVVTLTVEDGDGATGVDTATVTVAASAWPLVDVTSPAPGTTVRPGTLVALVGLATDSDDAPTSLVAAWSSSLETFAGAVPVAADGLATMDVALSTPGVHTLTLTVSDPAGHLGADATTLEVNLPADAPAVSISPAAPGTDDDLVPVVEGTDPEGDPLTWSYAWYRDGALYGTAAVVPASETATGETWQVVVSGDDGLGPGPSGEASVVIGNAAPSATGAVLTPDPAYAGDALTCRSVGFVDPDGDAEQSTVAWTVNGAAAGTGSALAWALVGGDAVGCTLTPSDGTAEGAPVTAALVVSNSAPVVTAAALAPDPARTDDTLVATATTYDPDGDEVSCVWHWAVDGAAVRTKTDTLSGSWFDRDQVVEAVPTCTDGVDATTGPPATLTISNTPPEAGGAQILPDPATTADSLSCTATGYTDADGDADQSTLAWSVNGLAAGAGASPSLPYVGGDVVTCTLTPHDGTDAGAAVVATRTITNTAPVATAVSLSPASPDTNDTLTATPSGADADGEALTWTYAWYVDGALVAATGPTLGGATWFDRDQVVYVVATPADGTTTGPGVVSSVVTVVNAAPAAPEVAITPEGPVEGVDDLVCAVVVDAVDPDGDPVVYTAAWTVDGVAYAGGTDTHPGDLVAAADTLAAERWACAMVATDGLLDSAPGTDETEILGEPLDYAHVQYPCTVSVPRATTFDVYGWAYMVGVTDAVGHGSRITAEAGVGDAGTYPWADSSWTWFSASYYADKDGPYVGDHANDEYVATLTAPVRAGTYAYAYRFSTDGGLSWTYADLGGDTCDLIGTTDGYDPSTAGVLTAS